MLLNKSVFVYKKVRTFAPTSTDFLLNKCVLFVEKVRTFLPFLIPQI